MNNNDLNFDNLFSDTKSDNNELLFNDEKEKSKTDEVKTLNKSKEWKILIVDDDEDIHNVTKLALDDFTYKNQKIEFIDTYSAKETEQILKDNTDIAIILLDVVMESTHAGLDLIKYIREHLGNKLPRIILRTGQAGQAPERDVIQSYEINDYKTKTELTATKLFTVVLSSLRAYESLIELKEYSKNLEKKVKERTKAITDSIHYASRIQDAIFPKKENFEKNFSDYFVINKPYDIVSGDFYWILKRENKLFFTVADCTGHGVPGAFMSMLGISFLNEIVTNNKYIPANEILNELRKNIINALHQSGKSGESRDGMDISLCILEEEYSKLQFAGANNPLYLIRNNELQEIKADKMPIGYYEKQNSFKNNEIQVEKEDILYLFTDGYADQFGGPTPSGKKFKYKAFKQLLLDNSNKPMLEQKNVLEDSFEAWKGKLNQIDDICIVGLKIQ